MIVRVSSSEIRQCPLCSSSLDGVNKFEEACQHLSETHTLKRLHIGQETSHDDEGRPWNSTVAVFGD
jgi:hypothetical protein